MSEEELKNYDSDEDEAEFRIKDNYLQIKSKSIIIFIIFHITL